MADQIQVTLTPDTALVQPSGDPVELVITITNAGATVDQYAVELDQLPTTWYSLSNTSVALFPQDKEEAKLVIHPPKGGGVKAGVYPFNLTVLSRADPTVTSKVEGRVQIGAVTQFDLAMAPMKQTGRKGSYTLTLRNGGNADLEVALEASDQDDACRYRFDPATPRVAPGQKQQVKLTVRPRRSSIAGTKKNFDFKVKATPSAGEAKSLQGQLAHRPRFRTWAPVVRLAALLALLAALTGGYLAIGGQPGFSKHASDWRASLCKQIHFVCAATATPAPTALAKATATGATPQVTPQITPKAPPKQTYPFKYAFYDFHKAEPSIVGDALEDEQHSQEGRAATQLTTTGVLIFDRKDGSTFLVTQSGDVYLFKNGVLKQARVGGSAPGKGTYSYAFAFADFHAHAATLLGDPRENQQVDPETKVATQQTSTGLLVFNPRDANCFLITRSNHVHLFYDDSRTQQVR